MIGTQFTITNNHSGKSIVINDHSDPDNVIALQQYPDFDVEIRDRDTALEGQHGSWSFFAYYGNRVTAFNGVIVAENEKKANDIKENLVAVLGLPQQPTDNNEGNVTVEWTDPSGFTWEIEGRLMRRIGISRRMHEHYRLDFNFSIKSVSPFILSKKENTVVGTRGYIRQGDSFPLSMPTTIGSGRVNVLSLYNEGAVESHTRIKIAGEEQGDVTNPRILNVTNGMEFKLGTVLSGEDDIREINSKTGTVVDADGEDKSGEITSDSQFILLSTGFNELMFSSDEHPTETLYLPTAEWRVRYNLTKI